MRKARRCLAACLTAFLLTVACLGALFFIRGIYPFGERSNLDYDMEIQYVDFLAYLKDGLEGRAGLEYSFSKSLGGPMAALIGYYLLSPFNLLLLAFQKAQIPLFIFVATALKLGLAAAFFTLLVSRRFSLSGARAAVLGAAYAFTQYGVGQMTNINWLDGLYMLPLMLLGAWTLYERGRRWPLLAATACSVIFNWYTGYMNCLFTALYLLYEALCDPARERRMRRVLGGLVTLALGVGVSCAVFLPVAMGQAQGRSALAAGSFGFGTNGTLGDTLRGLLIGTEQPDWQITIFCTVWALTLFFGYWMDRGVARREKIVSGALVGLMVASMLFQPLESVWCGLRGESSFVYRFLYTAIAAVLLVAARQCARLRPGADGRCYLRGAGLMTAVLLACDWIEPMEADRLWLQIALAWAYAAALWYLCAHPLRRPALRTLCALMLLAVVGAELMVNAFYITRGRYPNSARAYVDYVEGQQALVERVREAADGAFRMEQTSTRAGSDADLGRLYANESLAYHYRGLMSYSSCYEADTAAFLKNAGYCKTDFPTYYYQPLLPADSLLGVRYLLSERAHEGFVLTDLAGFGDKMVYENPYALPLAFGAGEGVLESLTVDSQPFVYLNAVYSAILGRETQVYKLLEAVGSTEENGVTTYAFPEGSFEEAPLFYAAYLGGVNTSALLVNGERRAEYTSNAWSPAMYAVCLGVVEEGDTLAFESGTGASAPRGLFATLDLERFEAIVEEIRARGAQVVRMEDGEVEILWESGGEGLLMTTIPYDRGWRATVNGEPAAVERAADAFLAVRTGGGEQRVVLRYTNPWRLPGLIVTGISLAAFAAWGLWEHKRRTRS